MKKYRVIMTGIFSLALIFGLTLMACKNDTDTEGGGLGGLTDKFKGRGEGSSDVAPSAPNIAVFVASETSITVSWSPVSGASGYEVHRANSNSGPYTSLAEISDVSLSYTDKGLSQNQLYYYKVRAYNAQGGNFSSSASAIITSGNSQLPSKPPAPTNVKATRISEDEVYVTWDPVSNVTTYLIYWAEEAAGEYLLDGTSNESSHTSKNWVGYTEGYFKVSALNGAGEGLQSEYARFGTYSNQGSSAPPSAPSTVTAKADSSSSITVTWSPVSGASGYEIHRKEDKYSFIHRTNVNSPTTTYTDTGLNQGTTYEYKIVAYNDYGGKSPESTSASARTQEGIPDEPKGVYASPSSSSSSITVYWTEVVGAASYKIYRSETNSNYSFITQVSAPSTSYPDTELSPNSTYYYTVRAVNSVGQEGPPSISASATTWSSSSSGSVLPAPTGVWGYQLSSDEVYVWWNSVSGAQSYVIYWSTTPNGSYYYDGQVEAPTTSFTSEEWDGLSNAYFKITAINTAGVESEPSDYAYVSLGGGSYYSTGDLSSMQKKLAIEKIR